MGREIRKVPPNWEHPPCDPHSFEKGPQPMFDQHYDDAKVEWITGLVAWENGTHEDSEKYGEKYDYWEWNGNPPEKAYYRAYCDSEATWFQVYETVSEGTPVSPPFETKEELAQWLAVAGDFWCQSRPDEQPPTIEQARAFIESEWGPSMMITMPEGKISGPYDSTESEER